MSDENKAEPPVSHDETPSVASLLEQGHRAAKAEKYDEAAEAFGNAVEIAPEEALPRYNLALAQQQLGDLEGAVATYLRTIQIDVNLIEAYINLGHLYSQLNLDEESLEVFQRAIELDATNDELFVALGETYTHLGFYEDAIQAFRQAEIMNADNSHAKESLHDVRERLNAQAVRIAELEHQLDQDPRDIDRYAEVIGAYLESRRYQDALTSTTRMAELFPEEPAVYETMALVYEMLGDIDSAATAWERVTQMDPEDVDAWEKLGDWRAEQGLMDEAIAAYRQAIALDPESPAARFRLAEALMEDTNYAEAITLYEQLTQDTFALGDDDELKTDAYVGLAEAHNAAGHYEAALASCTTLLDDYPDDDLALYQKATALDGLGRFDEAIDSYISSLENNPLNADTYNDLADTYIKIGDIDNAIEMAQMAVALMPEMDVAYETLAQALRTAGRVTEAAQAEEQARLLQSTLVDAAEESTPSH